MYSVHNEPNKQYIQNLLKLLPPVCRMKDLIAFGIFSSEASAFRAKKRGQAPDFIKLSERNVIYPKESVIEFVRRAGFHGSYPKQRRLYKKDTPCESSSPENPSPKSGTATSAGATT